MFGFSLNKFVENVKQQVPVSKMVSTLVGETTGSPPPSPPPSQQNRMGQPQQQQRQPSPGPGQMSRPGSGLPPRSPVPHSSSSMSGSGSGVFQQQTQPRPIPSSGSGLRQPSPGPGFSESPDRFSPRASGSGAPSPRMSMSPQPQHQPPPPPPDMMGDLAGLSEEERMHIAAVLQRAQMEMDAADTPLPPVSKKPPPQPTNFAQQQQQQPPKGPPTTQQIPPPAQPQPSVPPSSSVAPTTASIPVPTVTVNQPTSPDTMLPPFQISQQVKPRLNQPTIQHGDHPDHDTSPEEEDTSAMHVDEDEEPIHQAEEAVEDMQFLEPDREQRRLLFGSSEEGSTDHSAEEYGYHQQQQQQQQQQPYRRSSGQRYDEFADQQGIVLEEAEPAADYRMQQRVPVEECEDLQNYETDYQEHDQQQDYQEYQQDDDYHEETLPVPMGGDVEEQEEHDFTQPHEQPRESFGDTRGPSYDDEDYMRRQIISPQQDFEDDIVEETPPPPADYGLEDQLAAVDDQPISYSITRRSSSTHSANFQQQDLGFGPLSMSESQQIYIPRNEDYYYQTTATRTSRGSSLADLTQPPSSRPSQNFNSEPQTNLSAPQPETTETFMSDAELQEEVDDFEFGTRVHRHHQLDSSGGADLSDQRQLAADEDEAGLELCPVCRDTALDVELDASKVCADCERYVCKNCGSFEQQQQQQQQQQVSDLSMTSQARLRQWLCVECEARRQLELRRTLTEKWAVSSSKNDRNRLARAATISTELAHDMPQPSPSAQERHSGAGLAGSSPSKSDIIPHVQRRQSLPEAFDLEPSDMDNMSTVQEILADDAVEPLSFQRRGTGSDKGGNHSAFDIERSLSIGPSASEVREITKQDQRAAGDLSADDSAAAYASDRFSESTVHYTETEQGQQQRDDEQAYQTDETMSPVYDDQMVPDQQQQHQDESPTVSTRVQQIDFQEHEETYGDYEEETAYQEEEPQFNLISAVEEAEPISDEQPRHEDTTMMGSDVLLPDTEFEYQEERWYSKYSDENLQQSAEGTSKSAAADTSASSIAPTTSSSAVIPPIPDEFYSETATSSKQSGGSFSLSAMTVEELSGELMANTAPREFGVVVRQHQTPPNSASGETVAMDFQSSQQYQPQSGATDLSTMPPPVDLQQQWLQQFQGSTDFSYYSAPPSQPPPPPPVPPRQNQSAPNQQQQQQQQNWAPASSTPGLPSDLSPIMDVSPSVEEFEEELMIEQQKQLREQGLTDADEEEYLEDELELAKLRQQAEEQALADFETTQAPKQELPKFSEEELNSFYKCDDLSSSFSRLKKSPKFEFGLSDLVTEAEEGSDGVSVVPADVDATAIPHSESGDIQMESLGTFNIMVKAPTKPPSQQPTGGSPAHRNFDATQAQDIIGEDVPSDEKETYETNYESVHSISEDIVKSFSLTAGEESPVMGIRSKTTPIKPPPAAAATQKPTPAKPAVAPRPAPPAATVQPTAPLTEVAPKPVPTPVPPKPQQPVVPPVPPKAALVQTKSAPKVEPTPPPKPAPPPVAAKPAAAPVPAPKPAPPSRPPSSPSSSLTGAKIVEPTPQSPKQTPSPPAQPSPSPKLPVATATSPASRKQVQQQQQAQYQANLASQVERRDAFLRGSGEQPQPQPQPQTQPQPQPQPQPQVSKPSPQAVAKQASPQQTVTSPKSSKPQPQPQQPHPQKGVTFHVSPQGSTTSSTSTTEQTPRTGPAVAPKKKPSPSFREPTAQPAASSASQSSTGGSGDQSTSTPGTPTSAAGTSTTASVSSRSRARRKLPEVPPNAEPFNGPTSVVGAPISSLLQLAAIQRSTSPQSSLIQNQQILNIGSSRTLPRASRFAAASNSSLLIADSGSGNVATASYRSLLSGGIKRSSSAGRGTINGEQSPDNSMASLLVLEANQQMATSTTDRRVGFTLPGQRPLYINTAPSTSSAPSHFRSRSLPQSPGSHVSPRFSGSPIRVPSPGIANLSSIVASIAADATSSSSKLGSPRLSGSSLPPGGPRFVHIHGVTVPIEIKDVKEQLNLEIRLATANRRRMLDELEIRRLERQLEEIRELERQQKASMQKRMATAARGGSTSMQSSPTLRSALQMKQPGQQQMSVSFVSPVISPRLQQQQQQQQASIGQPRLLNESRWPAQKYPLQKQHSDSALFSPVNDMYGDYANAQDFSTTGASEGLLRVPTATQDDSLSSARYSQYGTLPRGGGGGGIISPNTGRIIPLSKYRKGDNEFPSPPIANSSAVFQQQQQLHQQSGGDEIDVTVALLKNEIDKRKEQIENTQILESELAKLTEEAKKRCEHLQTRIKTNADYQTSPPSNIVPPLGPGGNLMASAATLSKSNIIRPLAPDSPVDFTQQMQGHMLMTSPPTYAEMDPYAATMPAPVRMAPDFQFHHTGQLLRPQSMRQQQVTSPPQHMMGNFAPPQPPPQNAACNHCPTHSTHHPHPPQQHSHHSPFAPPGFPAGHYDDFTSRSGFPPQPAQQHQQIVAPLPGQRLAGSHAEMGGFQDFTSASRHVMCPHCSVHAGTTNHLLHHHPAGDFNHNAAAAPANRAVLAGLGQPVNQLIGRTTADGGRNDPSQLNAKRRTYSFPVKRILLTRDPRDKSVRSNGVGMRIVGGKQIPGAPEGELGAFVAQVFQGGVADQLHGEVKEGDQVLEWNGVSLNNRTFEDVLQIINQPCEEIEIVLRAGDPYHSASMSQINRPQSQTSFYDNMEDYNEPSSNSNLRGMTNSSTGGGDSGTFGDQRPVGRRGMPYYADERDVPMSRGTNNRPRLPSTGSGRGLNQQQQQQQRQPMGMRPESSSSAELLAADQQAGALPIDQGGSSVGGSGEIQLALTFDEYERILTVEVLRARNLFTSDDHLPSPYVRVRLNPVKGQNCIQTSSQLYSTSAPEFHQAFGFPLSSAASLSRRTVDICVWDMVDADRKRERLIGETVISLANSSLLDGRPHWFRLRPPSPAGMTPVEMVQTTSSSTMNAIIHPQPMQPGQMMIPQQQQQQQFNQQLQQQPMIGQQQQFGQQSMMPQLQQPQVTQFQHQQQPMQQQQQPYQQPQQQMMGMPMANGNVMMMGQQPQQPMMQQQNFGMMNNQPVSNNVNMQTGGYGAVKPLDQQQQLSRQRHLTGGNSANQQQQQQQQAPAHHRSVYFDDQIRCADDYSNNANMSQYR